MAAKKALLKKKPTRRQGFTYWNADQFAKLQTAAARKAASQPRAIVVAMGRRSCSTPTRKSSRSATSSVGD